MHCSLKHDLLKLFSSSVTECLVNFVKVHYVYFPYKTCNRIFWKQDQSIWQTGTMFIWLHKPFNYTRNTLATTSCHFVYDHVSNKINVLFKCAFESSVLNKTFLILWMQCYLCIWTLHPSNTEIISYVKPPGNDTF